MKKWFSLKIFYQKTYKDFCFTFDLQVLQTTSLYTTSTINTAYFLNELDTKIYKEIGGVTTFIIKVSSSLTTIVFSFLSDLWILNLILSLQQSQQTVLNISYMLSSNFNNSSHL